MADIVFYAQFIAATVGVDGLVVTWDIERITRSTGARAALVTGGATNVIVGRRGLYGYRLASADLTLYDYVATAITAGVADQREIVAYPHIDYGEAVWSHTPRTLTMSLTTLKSILTGNKLILWRGDTLALPMLNLGSLVGAADLWFTVKKHPADTDATAQIQISLVNGLQAIDGAAATVPANGSIVINNAVSGNITINLAAVETAKLDVDFTGYYDVQLLIGATVTTLTHGCCSVVGDTTRRIV